MAINLEKKSQHLPPTNEIKSKIGASIGDLQAATGDFNTLVFLMKETFIVFLTFALRTNGNHYTNSGGPR